MPILQSGKVNLKENKSFDPIRQLEANGCGIQVWTLGVRKLESPEIILRIMHVCIPVIRVVPGGGGWGRAAVRFYDSHWLLEDLQHCGLNQHHQSPDALLDSCLS